MTPSRRPRYPGESDRQGRGMETEAKDPFVARLEPEKVNYLEQEGWSLSLDGTQFTKVWDDGSQSEIDFDHVQDWSLRC